MKILQDISFSAFVKISVYTFTSEDLIEAQLKYLR